MREKKERNLRLYTDWKSGKSYRKLADFYHMDVAAAFRIVKKLKIKIEAVDNSPVDNTPKQV